MTRIYWLSRHTPLPAQLEELARVFGEMTLVEDRRPFGTAEEMLGRYTASGCTEMVVVVPESVLRRLIEVGLKPLRAKMVEVRELTHPDRETTAKHQVWRFEYFERVVRYEFLTERLTCVE